MLKAKHHPIFTCSTFWLDSNFRMNIDTVYEPPELFSRLNIPNHELLPIKIYTQRNKKCTIIKNTSLDCKTHSICFLMLSLCFCLHSDREKSARSNNKYVGKGTKCNGTFSSSRHNCWPACSWQKCVYCIVAPLFFFCPNKLMRMVAREIEKGKRERDSTEKNFTYLLASNVQ